MFKDKTIEMPKNFKDYDFDEFLVEVGRRSLYSYSISEGEDKRKKDMSV